MEKCLAALVSVILGCVMFAAVWGSLWVAVWCFTDMRRMIGGAP